MNRYTTLFFPDVNVWLALMLEHHIHWRTARAWWQISDGAIAFTRFTQISVLRLLTTNAAMDGKPITMHEAWRVHDSLYADDRVMLMADPDGAETRFREYTSARTASPKLWADAWLLAVAQAANGTLLTFDRALIARGAQCLLSST
ncbi:MAG TPA: TA system VapC family ribonuclease toxin [Bryobacteraceae bacterium]